MEGMMACFIDPTRSRLWPPLARVARRDGRRLVGVCGEGAARCGDDQRAGAARPLRRQHSGRRPAPGRIVADNWIASFDDDQLSAAVAEGIARNADLQSAPRASSRRCSMPSSPARSCTVGRCARARRRKLRATVSGFQGGVLTVNWELDLWGRVRSGRAASARGCRGGRRRISSTRGSRLRRRGAELVPCHRSGAAGRGGTRHHSCARGTGAAGRRPRRTSASAIDEDVFVARASVGTYRDALRQIELARERGDCARSSSLIGRYPAAAIGAAPQLPGPAAVESRSDCHPSCSNAGPTSSPPNGASRPPSTGSSEAKAARLPTIALTTGVSSISSDLFVLQDHEQPGVEPRRQPARAALQGGALKTQVEIRTAEQKQAIADYAGVGLRAFGEVEGRAGRRDCRARARADPGADDGRQSAGARVVQTQFDVGKTDLRFVCSGSWR